MKQKWIWIPIVVALLSTLLTPPAQAGLIKQKNLPVITQMSGTGMNVTQKVEGNFLKIAFELKDKSDAKNLFSVGLQFDQNEYEITDVTTGFVVMDDVTDRGSVEIGSLIAGNPRLTVTLRKKSDGAWSEIAPQSLKMYTGNKRMLAFEAAPAFTPNLARPTALSLDNYPNPFNPETTIKYSVPSDGAVKLTIYNALGQVVRTLVSEHQRAGEYAVQWKATNDTGQPVADGIYFYRITTPSGDLIRKMLLMK